MGLETGDFIDDLVATNPLGTDPVSEGDDHLTLIKRAIVNGLAGDASTTSLLSELVAVLVVGQSGTAETQWASAILNDVLEILGSVATVGDTQLASFDPAGAATLFDTGIARLRTNSTGATILAADDAAATSSTQRWSQQTGTVRGSLRFTDTLCTLEMALNGQLFTLRGFNAGALLRNLILADPDSGVTLFFDGLQMLSTLVNGIQIDGQTTWTTGSGSPEGVVTANPGSIYSDQVSGSSLPLWAKNFSNGNTGWVSCDVSAP